VAKRNSENVSCRQPVLDLDFYSIHGNATIFGDERGVGLKVIHLEKRSVRGVDDFFPVLENAFPHRDHYYLSWAKHAHFIS